MNPDNIRHHSKTGEVGLSGRTTAGAIRRGCSGCGAEDTTGGVKLKNGKRYCYSCVVIEAAEQRAEAFR